MMRARCLCVVAVLTSTAACRPPEAANSSGSTTTVTAPDPSAPVPASTGETGETGDTSGGDAPKPGSDGLEPMLPGLQKEVLATGTGKAAKNGDRLLVHYTGTLTDGTKFDSSVDRGTPFDFQLGKGQVIAGWELGLVGMQKGAKYKLTIPPHIGYGSTGSPPKIPPNATLVFVIELIDILPPE